MTEEAGETSAAAAPKDDLATGEAPPKAARGHHTLGWIVLVVLVAAGGIATSPWWAPRIVPLLPWSDTAAPAGAPSAQAPPVEASPSPAQDRAPATAQPNPALDQRLAGMEQRLAQLGQRIDQDAADRRSATPAASGQDAAIRDDALAPLRETMQRQGAAIEDFGKRIAALEQQLAARPAADPAALTQLQGTTGKLGTALAELDGRVAALAAAGAADTRADQALLLSLGQLRQTLQGSGPFVAELTAATTLARDRADVKAALAPLADAAAGGVPSLAILRQRFDGLAGTIADAGSAQADAGDWSDRILGRLRALVTVRRVGSAAVGSGPEAAVATAESALAAGDLAGAVAALGTLHGPAMLAARDWLDAARRRLAAEAALDKATALVTAELAPTPGKPGTGKPGTGKTGTGDAGMMRGTGMGTTGAKP
jgi:hypothetical protein